MVKKLLEILGKWLEIRKSLEILTTLWTLTARSYINLA
jgi:hypothetical protein